MPAGQVVNKLRNPFYSLPSVGGAWTYAAQTGGAGGSRIATFTHKAPGNKALAQPLVTRVYLSSTSNGLTPATAATTMTITTGTLLNTGTANRDLVGLTSATGVIAVTVTGAGTYYPVVVLADGSLVVGAALVIT